MVSLQRERAIGYPLFHRWEWSGDSDETLEVNRQVYFNMYNSAEPAVVRETSNLACRGVRRYWTVVTPLLVDAGHRVTAMICNWAIGSSTRRFIESWFTGERESP